MEQNEYNKLQDRLSKATDISNKVDYNEHLLELLEKKGFDLLIAGTKLDGMDTCSYNVIRQTIRIFLQERIDDLKEEFKAL